MITSDDIALLIVTRVNEAERIKLVYETIRSHYPSNEIVMIYDGLQHSLNVVDSNLKEVSTKDRVYVSGGYNLALKTTTKQCFAFLHDDTFIHKDFIHNLVPHIKRDTICNFTTVEPPMFGNTDILERPIQNFGTGLKDLKLTEFYRFCDERNRNLKSNVIPSPYGGFFMAGYVSTLLDIGGFDEIYKPFFYEDSDLMIRLHLNGTKFVQVLDSLVYHLVSLTSRNSEEGINASKTTESIFLKKWKIPFHVFKEYTMKNTIQYKKVRLTLECKNIDEMTKNFLVNFFDDESELPSSKLYIDGHKFTNDDLHFIQILPYIVSENNQAVKTKFELNNMILEIEPESILEPQIIANNL